MEYVIKLQIVYSQSVQDALRGEFNRIDLIRLT